MTSDVSMNRRVLLGSRVFEPRGTKVKWPTIRKAWLTDESVAEIRSFVCGPGRSIIFLDGEYHTNLNRYVGKDSLERAVFFEYMIRHPSPDISGGIFALCWIGNFHNGAIFHCGWQYPQIRGWERYVPRADDFFESCALRIYRSLVDILYKHSTHPMDSEVARFIRC